MDKKEYHRKTQTKSLGFSMAGMEGFEPPNARTKTWCLTTWPHPIINTCD